MILKIIHIYDIHSDYIPVFSRNEKHRPMNYFFSVLVKIDLIGN